MLHVIDGAHESTIVLLASVIVGDIFWFKTMVCGSSVRTRFGSTFSCFDVDMSKTQVASDDGKHRGH